MEMTEHSSAYSKLIGFINANGQSVINEIL